MRIIIVEDEIRTREGIRKLLSRLDEEYEVVGEALNGELGLEMILKEAPDLIITDVKMPQMDGLEMLEKAYHAGVKSKAIVLSAYSEFEYAKTAIRLGVTEYLVKPIVFNEFTQALSNVAKMLEKEKLEKPEQVGTLEQVLKGILDGQIDCNSEILNYLESKYRIDTNTPMGLLITYFDEWNPRKIKSIRQGLLQLVRNQDEIEYCVIEEETQQVMIIALYGKAFESEFIREIQSTILRNRKEFSGAEMEWAWSKSILQARELYTKLSFYRDWHITLGEDVIISYPSITEVKAAYCVYPVELEASMKNAICANDQQRLKAITTQFTDYLIGQAVYTPQNIKECYVKFFSTMQNVAKDIGANISDDEDSHMPLGEIMQARTRSELQKAVAHILIRIKQNEGEEAINMTVKKAVAMIHEQYQMGVTLDEIASRLNITPEYLGTQFHRSMGMNFSAYIKNYRINKAKQLLLTTALKLYDVGGKVGYSDPKYFSRVFKETTGKSPAEYRKENK